MKVGVIGCGGMGTTHYLSLKALSAGMDLEVAALADVRQEFLERASAHFPSARAYLSGEELLRKEKLDIVHICLPTYLHSAYAAEAMDRGMHVLVEKPVCLSMEEAAMLLQKEKETGRKVMVGQVVRSFEEYRYLKQVYEKGTYGKLQSLVMQRISGDVPWGFEDWFHKEEKSGSVVLDLHVHDVDFLRYMLGEPDSFQVKATAFDSGMINQILTWYEFGDVFVSAEGIWNVSEAVPFEAGFRACFQEAVVIFNGKNTPSLAVYKKDGTVEYPELKKEYQEKNAASEINISDLGPYYEEIKYFAQCVAEDKPVKRAPLSEGVKSLELALKEMEAAKQYIREKQSHKKYV